MELELRPSCVKTEVAILGFPSLIFLMVSVDVKEHWIWTGEARAQKTVVCEQGPWPWLCCFTSTEARLLIRYGGGGGGGGGTTIEWRLDRGYRPKKTGETVDRRQNNVSVKAVSPRHCCFNCRAGQSQGQCPLHCCWGTTRTTRSERSPTFAAQLHLPAHDLFWADLRVQLHLPPLDLAWNHEFANSVNRNDDELMLNVLRCHLTY